VQELLNFNEKREINVFLNQLVQCAANRNWEGMQGLLERWEERLPEFYEMLSDRAGENVLGWRLGDFAWNKMGKSIYPIGAGLAVFLVPEVASVAFPLAIMLADFSDTAGEQAARVYSDEEYTWGEAGQEMAYRAPFKIAKGLSYEAGPWGGSAVYGVTTFLEVAGQPSKHPISFSDRLTRGGVQGGVSLVMALGMAVLLRRFSPEWFFNLGSVESPEIFVRKPAFPTSEPPTSVEIPLPAPPPVPPPPPPSSPPSPPAPLPFRAGTGPRRVAGADDNVSPQVPYRVRRSVANGAEEARALPLEPTPKVTWTVFNKTFLAIRTFDKIPAVAQGRLERLIEQIRKSLEAGVDLTAMKNTKQVGHKAGMMIWEGRVMGPGPKTRVYFEIAGSDKKELRILGYSVGSRMQRKILEEIGLNLP
ncbi:MAG: hypothetical protein Q7S00_04040, partial [bacterium]|nr:hypothetical protein [bacterium]